jgi:class 3 adenylate cyclase/tetratricopeptide (TPR) repeat protein
MSSAVEQWLRKHGLEAHAQALADNDVGMEHIPHLTDGDLKELGFNIGHRVAFRKAATHLGTEAGTSALDLVSNQFSGERKLLTVLFCDIVDSTRLSTLMDAEELDTLLQAFFTQCETIAGRFGGVLMGKMGDGTLSWFGYPGAHEDDPVRAVHAGLAMARQLPTIRIPSSHDWRLNVRVSIATGHVVISNSPASGLPQAVGETPNRAERLKEACPVGSLVIDSATRNLVGANFEFVDLGLHRLKGFSEPAEVCQVLSARAGITRFEGSHTRGIIRRVVGRQGDLAMLKSRWELACQGEGQGVLLTGQAGIGKSRVASALADGASEQNCNIQLYQCSQLYQNTALYPVISRFMRSAEIRLTDRPEEKLRKLSLLPEVRTLASQQVTDLLASLLAIPAHEGFAVSSMSPENWRLAVFDAIARSVSCLAAQKPMLLVVEDMHWIDPTSLELFQAILSHSSSMPILILMTSRDQDLVERWQGADNFTHLQLNRLSPSQSRELCEEVVGSEAASKLHLDRIVKAAQGVPLFLEELVKHAIESPANANGPQIESKDSAVSRAIIPDHLFSFLAERLDKLEGKSGAKRVAQTASVFGHEFTAGLLAKIPSLQRIDNIRGAVDQLLNAGLVAKSEGGGEDAFIFRHSVFRDVAYASLLRSTRRVLHAEIAAVLVEAGLAQVVPDVIAYHLTEAGKPGEAVPYWTAAGLQSMERSATAEAFTHFSKGLSLMRQLPDGTETQEMELALRVGFGGVASAIEGYSAQDIEENYGRMLALASSLDRPRESFRAHLGLGAFYEVGGKLEKSQKHCDECLRSAKASGDEDELLHAHRLLGEVNFFKGEFQESCDHFEAALSYYDAADHLRLIRALGDDPGVLSHMYHALSLWFLGFPERAEASCRLGLRLASKLGHAFSSAQADFYASWLYAFERDFSRAKTYAERAIDVSKAQQFALVLGCSQVIRGWAMAQLGEQAAGGEEVLEGMALIRGPRADICESAFLSIVADFHLITGDLEMGLSVAEESRNVANERFGDPERLRLHGELLVSLDRSKAEALFREAMARARQQNSLSMMLRAALSLQRLLAGAGRTQEGEEILKEIYGQFTEGFDTPDLLQANAVLDATERSSYHG